MTPPRRSTRVAAAAAAKKQTKKNDADVSGSSLSNKKYPKRINSIKSKSLSSLKKSPTKKRKTVVLDDVNEDDAPSPLPLISLSTTEISVMSSTQVSRAGKIVTPTNSPIKSLATEVPAGSPPVDTEIDQFYPATPSSSLTVFKNNVSDEWYDAVLNQCNIKAGNNNNKYYRLQLLKSGSNNNKFFVWMKWGRVGEPAKVNTTSLKGPFATEEAALKVFAKKYKDKTANIWGNGMFVSQNGKYTRIQIDYNIELKQGDIEYIQSVLDPLTKEVIGDESLTKFDSDLMTLPLGIPSEQQIQIGVSILNEIEDKFNGTSSNYDDYAGLSSFFYTVIPHAFGRRRPPTIDTKNRLQQRYDMCETLLSIHSSIAADNTKKIPYIRSIRIPNRERLARHC